MSKAVFLDRDGTILREVNYLTEPSEMEILPRVPEAIKLLNEDGFKVVVITNQSAVARGYLTEEKLKQIHLLMLKELKKREAHIEALYHCPHHPDENCLCRKPNTALFERAIEEYAIDPERSYTIGDKHIDILAGHRVGTKTILLLTGYGMDEYKNFSKWDVKPDHVAQNLLEAARWIERKEELEIFSLKI